jgi:hypothetical protein
MVTNRKIEKSYNAYETTSKERSTLVSKLAGLMSKIIKINENSLKKISLSHLQKTNARKIFRNEIKECRQTLETLKMDFEEFSKKVGKSKLQWEYEQLLKMENDLIIIKFGIQDL